MRSSKEWKEIITSRDPKPEQAAGKGKEIAQSPKLLIDRNAKGKEGFGGGVNSTPN